jgi:EamA domain-containing membrane protein RarD
LYLVEASNALGFIVAPLIIVAAGYLFFKLVRVLSRIQMPRRPGS